MQHASKLNRIKQSVEVASLMTVGSPRSEGEDQAHIDRLAEAEWPLPPILVHRPTMRVIDGFHRVAAARLKGLALIDAYLVDGSEELTFIVGVQENVRHGLPLSLADRRAAAERIVRTYPQWSDRSIATTAGLSAKTVASIRNGTDTGSESNHRVGSDGRLRPTDTNSARRLAAELILAHPEASLRKIAQEVGLSPSTVRDVRARLERGENPSLQSTLDKISRKQLEPVRKPSNGQDDINYSRNSNDTVDLDTLLSLLSRDPALRMSASGRELLRWLYQHAVNSTDAQKITEAIIPHCQDQVIEFARQCAANWSSIAHILQDRSNSDHEQSPNSISA